MREIRRRRELQDEPLAGRVSLPDLRERVADVAPEHDGEVEILPGVRVVPAPGHTAGHQVVVVETDEGTVVFGGDVGYSFAEIGQGDTPGKRLVLELAAPTYLAHVREPHVPHPN